MPRCASAIRFSATARKFASAGAAARHSNSGKIMARLKDKYREDVVPAMMKEFGYKNTMQVPRLEKITLNIGLGEATQNIKALDTAVVELAAIAGQKPVVTRAKKAIANFKLREGVPIGCMVTLRRERMYEFLDRLIHAALPRVRDFKGISDRSFDRRGKLLPGASETNHFSRDSSR